jgi:hypothetical protein
MKSGEVDSVITGWEILRVGNLQDFETGEWLILSQWVDERRLICSRRTCRLSASSRAMKRNASY